MANSMNLCALSANGAMSSAGFNGVDLNVEAEVAGLALNVAVLGGAAWAVRSSFCTVEGGHRAIVFNRFHGLKDKVYGEGTHLLIPFIEWPIIYDVRAQPNVVESTSGSKDLQMVHITLRVLIRPVAEQLPSVYRQLGTDYAERVMPSIVQETLKAVVAHYNASQLITQREAVSREVRRMLEQRAATFHISVDDVSITELTFGAEFTKAIEAKQVAAQEAERAKFIVEKAEQDKRGAVIRAEGEARSAQLIGEAISSNPAFLTLRRIEAAREIATTIAGSQNRVYLSADSLLLNLAGIDLEPTPPPGGGSGRTDNHPKEEGKVGTPRGTPQKKVGILEVRRDLTL